MKVLNLQNIQGLNEKYAFLDSWSAIIYFSMQFIFQIFASFSFSTINRRSTSWDSLNVCKNLLLRNDILLIYLFKVIFSVISAKHSV